MAKKSIMIDLNDPRTAAVASVISNKTCKTILNLLAEKDLSESEIAQKLSMPINTVEYNLKKLIASGLVDKAPAFFWSRKGKKVATYCVSNKRIIIAPKVISRGILPAAIVSGLIALGIKILLPIEQMNTIADTDSYALSKGAEMAGSGGAGVYQAIINAPTSWAWFLVGSLTALLIFVLWNWKDS